MKPFLAKYICKLVKNKAKKQIIYDLLTDKRGGESANLATNPLTLDEIRNFKSFSDYILLAQNINYARLDSKLQAQFQSKIAQLKAKIKARQKIKVCFYVIYDSCFPFEPLFKKMQSDLLFEPYVVIIPDTSRGKSNMFYQVDKGYKSLSEKYGDFVHKCYDLQTKDFIDFTPNMDILATSQPYETMSDEIYSINYATSKQILTIFAHYTMEVASWGKNEIVPTYALNLCWKIFVNTKYGFDEHQMLTLNNGKNAILSGYVKMDSLFQVKPQKRERKKIIIAPHHTIYSTSDCALQLSSFLQYADFFLEIYERYPQIDFIFRPHPLLVIVLAKDEYWGQKKLDSYLAKLKTFKNVTYQEGGEYFETFVNSDGILHDCGSFVAEYLYTDNPCCFMLKDSATNENNFALLGKECLKHYYQAFDESDIIDFIENVVIKGNDTKKAQRITFAKEVLRVNFPNVADKILDNIKSELL